MTICVIFNPAARAEKARRFRCHLAELSRQCALKPTEAPGAGWRLAAEAVREGFETIVAAGGDGTVNEVVNGIAEAPDGLARARLGLLPLGTVNVFAKELGIPADFQGAWRVITAGRETRIDLPEAEFTAAGGPQRRCFVQMAGAGVDTRAIALVDWELKKKLGPLAYWVSGFQALRGAKPQVTVSAGARRLSGEQVLIGNGRFYGGRHLADLLGREHHGQFELGVARARATSAGQGRWRVFSQNSLTAQIAWVKSDGRDAAPISDGGSTGAGLRD